MTFLELAERLGLWPFDPVADEGNAEARDKASGAGCPIQVPHAMQPEVQIAQWPTEYDRRTRH
jgi:hypothetical protein